MKLSAAIVATLLAVPTIASAQEEDENKEGEAGGTEVELEDDVPPEDMEGTAENPDAPVREVDEVDKTVAPGTKESGYPVAQVKRPITLPQMTSEVGLDAGFIADPVDLELGFRARYGITRQWQVGLRYLIGGVYEDGASMDTTFNTGKAFGLDVTFLAKDFIAAHLTIPVYVDPVAVGIILGAPIKYRFANDKLAIVALDDFLEIMVATFSPSLTSERHNEALVVSDMAGDILPRTRINLNGGVEVQLKPDLALRGMFHVSVPQGGSSGGFPGSGSIYENKTGIDATLQFTPSPRFDVWGKAGWDTLETLKSFGITAGAQFRI